MAEPLNWKITGNDLVNDEMFTDRDSKFMAEVEGDSRFEDILRSRDGFESLEALISGEEEFVKGLFGAIRSGKFRYQDQEIDLMNEASFDDSF